VRNPPFLKKTILALYIWLPPVAYAALIFYASSQSSLKLADKSLIVWDKMAHFFEYAILALLILRVSRTKTDSPWRAAILAAAISIAYGISDEFHQSFVPNRTAEVGDLAMNTLGAILAVAPFTIPKIYVKDRTNQKETLPDHSS